MASSYRIISRARIRLRRFAPVAFHSVSLHGGLLLSIRALRRPRRPVYADKIPICCRPYCDKPDRFAIRMIARNAIVRCSMHNVQCCRFRTIKYRFDTLLNDRFRSRLFYVRNKAKAVRCREMLKNGWRRCRRLRT